MKLGRGAGIGSEYTVYVTMCACMSVYSINSGSNITNVEFTGIKGA